MRNVAGLRCWETTVPELQVIDVILFIAVCFGFVVGVIAGAIGMAALVAAGKADDDMGIPRG